MLVVLGGFARVAPRELLEDAVGVGEGDGVCRLALVLHQKAPELVHGHEVPILRELGEDCLDVGRWAPFARLELPVEALEHLVVVAAIPHCLLNLLCFRFRFDLLLGFFL